MLSKKAMLAAGVLGALGWLTSAQLVEAADCNGNGTDDAADLLPRDFGFLAEASYAGGGHLLIAADLDGDGRPDLATAGPKDPNDTLQVAEVSVLLNRGDGTFRDALPHYSAGGLPGSDGPGRSLIAADLDRDGMSDLVTANRGSVSIFLNQTTPPFSLDLNRNGIPDECESRFRRGDCTGDGSIDLSDAVRDLRFCFSGQSIPCAAACDADGDGNPCTGVTDGVQILMYLFGGGAPLPAPFPECGTAEGEVDCDTPPASCP